MSNVIRMMTKARFLANEEEAKEIMQDTIIELSSQVEALKAQVETSRLHIETLITQNAELSSMVRSLITDKQILENEIQEVKAKNLETRTKFDAFVNALYKPPIPYDHMRVRLYNHYDLGTRIVDNLYGLIEGAVKAAGMDS